MAAIGYLEQTNDQRVLKKNPEGTGVEKQNEGSTWDKMVGWYAERSQNDGLR